MYIYVYICMYVCIERERGRTIILGCGDEQAFGGGGYCSIVYYSM